jgi:hypothetical protein
MGAPVMTAAPILLGENEMTTAYSTIRRSRAAGFLSPRENQIIQAAMNGIATEINLLAAISEAEAGDLILLAPTTITLTSQLSITKALRFKSSGRTTITGAFATNELISINSLATGGAKTISFEDIDFVQGTDDVDVIAVNNTGATGLTSVRFRNCTISVYDAAANAFAIDVAHAVTGQGIALVISGSGIETCDAINFTIKNTADVIEISQMKLQDQGKATAIITSADNIAASIRLLNCEVPHELGTSGGHASQLLISLHSWSRTTTTFAAADTNDFIGSHTETIV